VIYAAEFMVINGGTYGEGNVQRVDNSS
jgi:hypothetical protein